MIKKLCVDADVDAEVETDLDTDLDTDTLVHCHSQAADHFVTIRSVLFEITLFHSLRKQFHYQ